MALLTLCTMLAGGCSSEGDLTTNEATPIVEALQVVVIGDSIPHSSGFCPGCVGFVDQFAQGLEATTGRAVNLSNRSRNDSAAVGDIRRQVTDDASLRDQLSGADVVLVSVGFNDQAPWPAEKPCHAPVADTLEDQVEAILQLTDSCIAETVSSYRTDYAAIFAEVSQLASDSAVLLVLTVYNNALGYPDLEAMVSPADLDRLEGLTRSILDAWNVMLCEAGAEHGFSCVDVYHAFNGADGNTPPGDALQADYTHPSQRGNDIIAGLLAEVEVHSATG